MKAEGTGSNYCCRFASATQLKEADSVKLDEICRLNGVSLVLARTYGLIGTVRVSVPECCILETHPDSVVADTRVHEPWPELLEMADSIDLASLDDMHHAHVPWALLLVKCGASRPRRFYLGPPRKLVGFAHNDKHIIEVSRLP